jgi:hypothetical protein
MINQYQIQRIAESLCIAQGQAAWDQVPTQDNGWQPRYKIYEDEVKRTAFIMDQIKLAEMGML